MQKYKDSHVRMWVSAPIVFVFAVGLLGMIPWPQTHRAQRIAAQSRWDTRSFTNYRVTIEIERLRRVCFQELEIRNDKATTINDTCDISWMSSMTVQRLFEFSSWMERAPDCYPSSRNCPCQRVRIGEIEYNPQFGYPQRIAWERQVQANVDHIDFWRRLWETHALPQCSSSAFPIRMDVVSLVPIQ